MQAMILAAGFGTRLRPYTLIRPKPLFPVLNKPLLLILLDMLRQIGCERITVNSHHLAAQIEQALARWGKLTLQYEPEILGTGGCLRRALASFSDEPVLVINGDIFHNIDLAGLYRYHVTSKNKVTMALHDCPRYNAVRVDGQGKIRGFSSEKRRPAEKLLAYTGIQVVNPEVIERIPFNQFHHIIDLYDKMAGQGEGVDAFSVTGSYWCDMGTVDDYLRLHQDLLTGDIVSGIILQQDPTDGWLIGETACIDPAAELNGWGCIGEGVFIGPEVILENCVVWDNVRVDTKSFFNNALLAGDVPLS